MQKTLSAPFDVVLCVTSKCNFSCVHCSVGNMLDSNDDFSKEELLHLVDELVAAKVFQICVFGGEPFCREDILEIIEYIHSKPVGISLNTNATLVGAREASFLAKLSKLKTVCVSLDGDSAQSMDAMRGRGAFEGAIRGLEHILSTKKLGVMLSVTVTRFNFGRLRGIVLLGKELGVSSVRFNSVFLGGNAGCGVNQLLLSPKEHRECLSLVEELRNEFGAFVTGSCLQEVDIIKDLELSDPVRRSSVEVHPCGAAMRKCCISANGGVSPCEVIIDVEAGNVKEKGFLEVWRNSKVLQGFRESMEYSLESFPECIECRYSRLCYQGHRCSPYFNARGISAKDASCIIV